MNGTETVKIPEAAKPIEEKALAIIPQIRAVVVKDEATKELAGAYFNQINEALGQIGVVFDPLIEAAKEAKRKADAVRAAIVDQKERFAGPWNTAKAHIVGQLTAFKDEQDRKRREEEERLRQEAIKEEMAKRKAEEEARIKAAAELEAAGATEEAAAMVEEAVAESERPKEVYVPPAPTAKVEFAGGGFRETWHAEVTDLKKLCLAIGQGRAAITLVEANMPALNKLAIALKGQMNIDGVKAVRETGLAKAKSRPISARA
jgi:hypothetical protein